jgi:phosphate starvation-inducible protein PhoH
MARNALTTTRVVVATCSNSTEATTMKALLRTHGIACTVSGENHAALLGQGGAFITQHLQVATADAETARALIEQARIGVDISDEDLEAEALHAGSAGDHDRQAAQAPSTASDSESLQTHSSNRTHRRRIAVAALASCTITFGTGHMVAGAWLRAMTLAGLEIVGLRYSSAHEFALGITMVVSAVVMDLVGSQLELRRQALARQSEALPVARVVT